MAKKAPVVSKDKHLNKAKRKNVVKKAGAVMKEADLLKMKKEHDAKRKQATTLSVSQKREEEDKKEDEVLSPNAIVEDV